MALAEERKVFPFIQGIDTKSDSKQVSDFSLAELENAVFTTAGALSLRNGFKNLAAPPFFSAAVLSAFPGLTAANELTTFRHGSMEELVAMGSGVLASYNASKNSWVGRGPLRAIKSRAHSVVANNLQQQHPDVATLNGTTVYAYEEAAPGSVNPVIRALVVDEATGAVQQSNAIGIAGAKPRVVASGQYIYVLFLNSALTSLLWYRFSARNPTAAPVSGTLVAAGLNGSAPFFCAKAYGATGLVVSYVDGSSNIQTVFADGLPLIFGQLGNVNRPPVAQAAAGITALGLCLVGTQIVVMYATFSSPNTTINAVVYNPDLSVGRNPGAVANAGAVSVFALTGCTTNSSNNNVTCFYEVYQGVSGQAYNAQVRKVTFGTTGSSSSDGAFLRHAGLLTEAFIDAEGLMVGVVFDSLTQPTAFFVDTNLTVVAKALWGRAGGIVNYPRLSNVVRADSGAALTPGKWITAICGRTQVKKNGQLTYQPKSVARVTLETSLEEGRNAQLGKVLAITGGAMSAYAGTNDATLGGAVSEYGFHLYPEQPVVSTQTVGVTLFQMGKKDTAPQIYSLTFPSDFVGLPSLSCAQRIRPGEYVILFGESSTKRCYLWFNVAGQGTDPALAGMDADIQVNLSTNDNQNSVAQKVAAAITNAMQGDPSGAYLTPAVQPDNSVQVRTNVPSATGNEACAVADTQLGITTTQVGDGTHPQITRFVFPAGKWIGGGQWFSLYGYDSLAGRVRAVAFYFTVDGAGISPSLSGYLSTNAIAILSTDDPFAVATKAKNAIVAVTAPGPLALWTGAVSGPVADITDVANNQVTFASNGSVGGVPISGGASSVSYKALYSFLDGQATFWRSADSAPLVVNIPAQGDVGQLGGGVFGTGQTYYSAQITVITLAMTRKGGVKVELYRTETGSGAQSAPTFYKLASADNSPAADSVSFTDTTLDVDLRSGEIIYTFGGVLPNLPPPPCSLVCTWQGRLVVVDNENPNTLWLSQVASDGVGTGFSDVLARTVDAAGGDIAAIWVQDEKLIISKRSRLFYMVGDGPDPSGNQDNWISPRRVETDTGCNNPDSVLATQEGTFFQSDKGIYLLRREGTEVEDLGRPALKYKDAPITDAVMMPGTTSVRFLTSSGLALIYDYEAQQWGTLTGHNGVGACIWSNLLAYVTVDGQVRLETPGAYTDPGGEPISMKVATNWIPLAGIQGFGRVRKVHVLGEYRSPHKLQLSCAFDNDPATAGLIAYDATAQQGGSLFGSASPFGADAVFGGSPSPNAYQFRWYMPRQKCTSVRFTIQTIPQPGGSGEAVQLSGLMLELGVKKANKPATSRSIG